MTSTTHPGQRYPLDGRRAWAVWAAAISVYVLAVFHRTSLGVAGLEAADRFGISSSQLSTFTILQVFVYAVLPQVRVAWTGISIYSWDVCFRAATVVGFFGAGGMGWYLRESVQRVASKDVAAILLSIIVVVILSELFSAWLRKRISRAVA